MQNRAARFLRVMARLRPGFGLAEARAELALIRGIWLKNIPSRMRGLTMIASRCKRSCPRCRLDTLAAPVCGRPCAAIACVNIASLLLRARGFTRAGACHACSTGGWAWAAWRRQCLTESRNLRRWRRPARRGYSHSSAFIRLLRFGQQLPRATSPSGLARNLFSPWAPRS